MTVVPAWRRSLRRQTPPASVVATPMRTAFPPFFQAHHAKGSLASSVPSLKLRCRYQSSTTRPGGAMPSTPSKSFTLLTTR